MIQTEYNGRRLNAVEIVFARMLIKQGIEFDAQVPIGPRSKRTGRHKYYIDFVVQGSSSIAIEIDGSQHYSKANMKKDAIRDKDLEDMGYIIVRIPAQKVIWRSPGLLDPIKELI